MFHHCFEINIKQLLREQILDLVFIGFKIKIKNQIMFIVSLHTILSKIIMYRLYRLKRV